MEKSYDVFISYSRKDRTIADRICEAFDKYGITYFIDRQGISGGMEFPDVLANAIYNSKLFLYLASKNSYDSKFTKSEITFAFNEKPHNSILIYQIDGSTMPPSMSEAFSSMKCRNIYMDPIKNFIVYDIVPLLRNWHLPGSQRIKFFPLPNNLDSSSHYNEDTAHPLEFSDRINEKPYSFRPALPREKSIDHHNLSRYRRYYSSASKTSSCKSSLWSKFMNLFTAHIDALFDIDDDFDEDIKEKSAKLSVVNACVYTPGQIRRNKSFVIRIYFYKPEDGNKVDSKMNDIDPNAKKKEYKPLDIPVKDGDKISVHLKMSDGVLVEKNSKSLIWHNHYKDCSFIARLTDSTISDVYGAAYVFINDIPAGELLFTIDVVDSLETKLYAKVETQRYSRIFISYSHEDIQQVIGFAECCKALGTDYFFDRHTLKAGDIFKEKIFDYINSSDLFILCWSKNAANSEWVQIEREHALALVNEGKSKLYIYPLNLKPEAPLPLDMKEKYNFGTL